MREPGEWVKAGMAQVNAGELALSGEERGVERSRKGRDSTAVKAVARGFWKEQRKNLGAGVGREGVARRAGFPAHTPGIEADEDQHVEKWPGDEVEHRHEEDRDV
jgi:hypothetical protein